MVGLPEQTPEVFMEDITHVLEVNPDQVTIYPFMELGKIQAVASLPDRDQFKLIEDAYAVLHQNGFARKAIWVFAKGEDIYDTSRDELIDEYLGFGPAGFSTFGTFKVVNPELDVYLKNSQQDKKMALVAPKDKMSDEWRIFARMVYDLAGKLRGDVSFFIKLYVFLLKTGGYIRCQKFTKKGVIFSHTIVKTVVENLPYPLQNVDRISNYEDYLKEKEES